MIPISLKMAEMKSEKTERCLRLCEQGASEHDRQHFHDIIRELNRSLSKKGERLVPVLPRIEVKLHHLMPASITGDGGHLPGDTAECRDAAKVSKILLRISLVIYLTGFPVDWPNHAGVLDSS